MNLLFMCVANSARSQLAEGMARHLFKNEVHIESAGSKPSKVNPYAIQAMEKVGIDLSSHYSKAVDQLPKEFVSNLDFVITLCAEEVCPVVITKAKKLHWPLPDPAGQAGSETEQLGKFITTRNEIKDRLISFGKEFGLLK